MKIQITPKFADSSPRFLCSCGREATELTPPCEVTGHCPMLYDPPPCRGTLCPFAKSGEGIQRCAECEDRVRWEKDEFSLCSQCGREEYSEWVVDGVCSFCQPLVEKGEEVEKGLFGQRIAHKETCFPSKQELQDGYREANPPQGYIYRWSQW